MNPMQFMMNQMGNMGNMIKGQTNAKGWNGLKIQKIV